MNQVKGIEMKNNRQLTYQQKQCKPKRVEEHLWCAKRNNCQPRIIDPVKTSFRMKAKYKHFDEGKLGNYHLFCKKCFSKFFRLKADRARWTWLFR